MSAPQKLSVAVVGAGVGASHVAGYRAHPDRYRMAAVCDLDIERAKKVAGEGTGTKAITDMAELLADPQIDIIDVSLPPHLHFSATISALEAGKHVVCEKPMTTSMADVDAVEAAMKRTGKQVLPVFQYRFGPGFQKLLHLMEKGLAGKPYSASLETHWKRGAAYYDVPWRGTWSGEQGGAIVGHAIHIHNLMTRLLGPVVEVGAFLDTKVNPIETEDSGAIAMRTQSGALVTSSISLGSATDMSRIRICFEHLTAESGLDPYTIGSGDWTFVTGEIDRQASVDAALAEVTGVVERYEGLALHIHKALTGEPDAGCATFDEARHSIELITAIYQAARTRTIVPLPLDKSHPLYTGWVPKSGEAA